ncbi:uncharacterized protein BJ212DRAFT_1481365 [Suillus subaureus]|uniref:Yeast cell wall synthesis Kre9/Knh1-like N-terminal domain-containing protein n=1 Tax=Suillus subaureus TaxID=48587 RepID=A0A9P7EAC2_9AGAM|nr:uncharacterized protein BJ212DRAFT_1481365 [Suillus subaureus]KAG1815592.1 hypothetical protein BJ212DRAFT_1481365 [Suillus subaureus]
MRSSAAILLASIASAFAYQVTSPGDSEGWTTSGPNYLTWVRVDTDPLNFTAVLTNEACNQQTVMPQGPQVLNALVDGTLGSIVCNPPSGGWPQGSGYRVNLAADAQHLDTLLAQSAQFNINSTSSSTSSTTKTSTTSFSSGTTSGAATQTTTGASTTSSDTSTTPTSSGAAVLGMKVETGFLTAIAALAAFITTHF